MGLHDLESRGDLAELFVEGDDGPGEVTGLGFDGAQAEPELGERAGRRAADGLKVDNDLSDVAQERAEQHQDQQDGDEHRQGVCHSSLTQCGQPGQLSACRWMAPVAPAISPETDRIRPTARRVICVFPGFGLPGVAGIFCLLGAVYLALVDAPIPRYSWEMEQLNSATTTVTTASTARDVHQTVRMVDVLSVSIRRTSRGF